MSMTAIVTLAAGILGTIGLGGILCAGSTSDEARREWLFRLGAGGLTIGGLVLMVGSLLDWQGSDAMFLGLMMVVFGVDAKVLPGNSCTSKQSHRSAQ